MANKGLSDKLKELRLKNKLTQKDVYEELGISQSTFSSWEIGKSEPDAMTFLALCKLYNVKDILLEFTGESISKQTDDDYALYKNLDEIDQAEVRGTMKQMLKANKYQVDFATNDSGGFLPRHSFFSDETPAQVAAFGGEGVTFLDDEE